MNPDFLSPYYTVLAFLFGSISLTWLAVSVYKRYKNIRWQAACDLMEAEAPTDDEKEIGDEWKSLDDAIDELEAKWSPKLVDEATINKIEQQACATLNGWRVDPCQETKFHTCDPAVTLPSMANAHHVDDPDWLTNLSQAMLGTLGEVFAGNDGGKYKYVKNNKYDVTVKDSKEFFKVRVYSQNYDVAAKPMPMPNALEMETETNVRARQNVDWLPPIRTESDSYIPGLVNDLVNNNFDLKNYYKSLSMKDLTEHVAAANLAGRERAQALADNIKNKEKEIMAQAQKDIAAMKVSEFEEKDAVPQKQKRAVVKVAKTAESVPPRKRAHRKPTK